MTKFKVSKEEFVTKGWLAKHEGEKILPDFIELEGEVVEKWADELVSHIKKQMDKKNLPPLVKRGGAGGASDVNAKGAVYGEVVEEEKNQEEWAKYGDGVEKRWPPKPWDKTLPPLPEEFHPILPEQDERIKTNAIIRYLKARE